jgi:ATP-dependent protease HslVU (ClpYQ) peptidase subunit
LTCIVAFKTIEGHSVIAGDFMASNGHNFAKVANSKVFNKSENCAVGYTSSFRMGQILEHYWTLPARMCDQELDSYVNVTVVESLRAVFSKYGYGIKDGIEDLGGNFILLYEDRIYEVQYNYSVLDYDSEIISIGSGSDAAQGALYALLPVSTADLDNLLAKVFEATSLVTATVSPEFSYIVLGEVDVKVEGTGDAITT